MVSGYEIHVIFQGTGHQFQENIPDHFLHYNFFMKSWLNEDVSLTNTQYYLLEVFMTLPNNHLHLFTS